VTGHQVINVAYRKWDGSLHWHFDLARLGEDDHGLWLGGADGTPVRRGDEPPLRSQAFTLLIPREGWWTAVWNAVATGGTGFPFEVYVDVCSRPERTDAGITAVDLDLDVARRPDGTTVLLDEDEFEEHRRRYGYPDHVVDRARTTAAALVLAVENRNEPFDLIGPAWLDRAIALGESG
jgi:protein associated with RNAse G/E